MVLSKDPIKRLLRKCGTLFKNNFPKHSQIVKHERADCTILYLGTSGEQGCRRL